MKMTKEQREDERQLFASAGNETALAILDDFADLERRLAESEQGAAGMREALINADAELYKQRQRCDCRAKMTGQCPRCQRISIVQDQIAALAKLDARRRGR